MLRLILSGICTALIAYAAFIEPNWLVVTVHELQTNTVGQRVRVVQLSDLHLQRVGTREEAIAEKLREIGPDIIVLSGDVIDKADSIPLLDSFLQTLGPAPKVAVLGNWEYWGDVDFKALRSTYEANGAKLLINEVASYRIKGRTLNVTGMDDFTAGQPSLTGLASHGGAGTTLLIQHSPGWFGRTADELKSTTFDLCLSGHTHGGQVTLFGLPVWTPHGSGTFTSGFYDTAVCPLYVSRGLGTSVLPVRIGARPEIAVFDL